MSFANKFNKNTSSKFTFDTTDFDYIGIDELEIDKVYPLNAFYINSKGRYMPHPCVAIDNVFVSMPAHLTKTFEDILNDEEAIADINAGHVGFKVYEYHSDDYDKDCRSINFVDM